MEAAPVCAMMTCNSRRIIATTVSTPSCPNEERPQIWGRPIPTAVAPSASALKAQLQGVIEPSLENRGRRTVVLRCSEDHDGIGGVSFVLRRLLPNGLID